MMNFCWGMKFFLDNILGYENKGWILAKKSNKKKSAKVSRFDILCTFRIWGVGKPCP